MNRITLTAIAAAMTLAFSAGAMAGSMSKDEYQAGMKSIQADYNAAKATCNPLLGNAKDICKAEAKGKENVAHAQLEATYEPSAKHSYDVRIAKANADFAVAEEKCDDLAGNAKDVCKKEAKSAKTAAKADAKTHLKTVEAKTTASEKSADAREQANKKIVAVRKDAAEDKRDAEYAVAKEKCDALSGAAKDTCRADAKARFSKS